jgi:hypothetical protein
MNKIKKLLLPAGCSPLLVHGTQHLYRAIYIGIVLFHIKVWWPATRIFGFQVLVRLSIQVSQLVDRQSFLLVSLSLGHDLDERVVLVIAHFRQK